MLGWRVMYVSQNNAFVVCDVYSIVPNAPFVQDLGMDKERLKSLSPTLRYFTQSIDVSITHHPTPQNFLSWLRQLSLQLPFLHCPIQQCNKKVRDMSPYFRLLSTTQKVKSISATLTEPIPDSHSQARRTLSMAIYYLDPFPVQTQNVKLPDYPNKQCNSHIFHLTESHTRVFHVRIIERNIVGQ